MFAASIFILAKRLIAFLAMTHSLRHERPLPRVVVLLRPPEADYEGLCQRTNEDEA
jgi:hypothetical protein